VNWDLSSPGAIAPTVREAQFQKLGDIRCIEQSSGQFSLAFIKDFMAD